MERTDVGPRTDRRLPATRPAFGRGLRDPVLPVHLDRRRALFQHAQPALARQRQPTAGALPVPARLTAREWGIGQRTMAQRPPGSSMGGHLRVMVTPAAAHSACVLHSICGSIEPTT